MVRSCINLKPDLQEIKHNKGKDFWVTEEEKWETGRQLVSLRASYQLNLFFCALIRQTKSSRNSILFDGSLRNILV